MATESSTLTPAQLTDLLDVLSHYETYNEIEEFKTPGAIYNYGPPFQDTISSSGAPILQSLLAKFVLKLPGLRDVPDQFWKGHVEPLIQELSEAELSESYDKGVLGIRKTLATAIAALIEYPARGILDFPRKEIDSSRKYDVSNPEDVHAAWQDCVQELVYGDLIDRLVKRVGETEDLSQHEPVVQGSTYARVCRDLLQLLTFPLYSARIHSRKVWNLSMLDWQVVLTTLVLHRLCTTHWFFRQREQRMYHKNTAFRFLLTNRCCSLVRMIESVHNLLPYMVMRQTLKIGNVATMLSGLVRVVLAKASISSVTNWMGLSSGADEGMNLMQQ